jgi:glycosyltransferase involved in cell wall biosynthesis
LFNIFNYYSNGLVLKKYNVELLKRKWCFDYGKNGNKLDMNDFADFVIKYSDNIISNKCLIISKKINGYGGNQKTALQIIQLLEKYFIVEIFSNNMNQKEYNFIKDSLDCRIHNMKIIKKKKDNEIIMHINKNNYKFIINNKFNDYFKIFDKINNKNLYIITHNSMDPFNELIIKNQEYIAKVFTINKFHQNVLIHHGLKIQQEIYYNYVEKEEYEVKRTKFKNRIGFIGRFTKEKNLELLIECMQILDELELVIIGGENNIKNQNKNIIWKGILQKDEIISELRKCDYLVVPSSTEGLPFVILESMNLGIPCIYSNIIGADELIGEEGERGFTFELRGYEDCKMKMDWNVFEEVGKYKEENIRNILECIKKAYNIPIKEWNKISKNCKEFIRHKYFENITSKKNLKSLEII